MVVERARGESQSMSGSLQSLCWGFSAFGGIVSSYFSGSLVDAYGVRYIFDGFFTSLFTIVYCNCMLSWTNCILYFCFRFVFGVTALLPLITSSVALLVKEQRVTAPSLEFNQSKEFSSFLDSSKERIVQLWYTVKQPNVFFPTLFIFLWQATPQSDSAMFFFTYDFFVYSTVV